MRFRTIILFILTVAIVSGSCGSRRTKLDRKNIIPEKELVPILKDLYITDGLIGLPKVLMKYAPLDSASTYNYVIEQHGYTKEDLDRTMKYYFVRNPKRLIKIYDKVLSILSEQESRTQKEIARTRPKLTTLWNGPEFYAFPDPSGNDSTTFSFMADKPGFYILSANVTLFPDDNSFKPAIQASYCNADSLKTGKRRYVRSFPFIRDGRAHRYKISIKVPAKSKISVEGNLYDIRNQPEIWDRHLYIQNITLVHSTIDQ